MKNRYTIRIIDSPFDGQYVVAYDPDKPGKAPDGKPMLATIETTPEPLHARLFDSPGEAMDCYRQVSAIKPLREDGRPNRPMTALMVEIAPMEVA